MVINEQFDTGNHRDGAEYFCRLFQIADAEPSLEHVSTILRNFAVLPYENLSKILNLNRKWDDNSFRWPYDIIGDYEKYRLGGTCFSLTFFLKTILDHFGYHTAILMADMKVGKNTHCALLLDFNSREYLLDPGYLLQYPLPLDSSLIIGKYSLVYDATDDRYALRTIEGNQQKWRYSFRKEATTPDDFRHYWENSFHWMTMHGICLSKRGEDGFIYLHNHYLKIENANERFKGNIKSDTAELVRRWFGIPPEIVRRAEIALLENLHHDRDLGFQVPKWVK